MPEATSVHIAVFHPATGAIRQVSRVTVDMADQQHVHWEGHDYVEVPAGTSPQLHQIDLTTKSPIPRVATAEEISTQKRQDDARDVSSKITGGFTSSALGEAREYPSAPHDQTNMVHAAQVGGKLWSARSDGQWDFLDHTVEQAKQVLLDFVAFKDALRGSLA